MDQIGMTQTYCRTPRLSPIKCALLRATACVETTRTRPITHHKHTCRSTLNAQRFSVHPCAVLRAKACIETVRAAPTSSPSVLNDSTLCAHEGPRTAVKIDMSQTAAAPHGITQPSAPCTANACDEPARHRQSTACQCKLPDPKRSTRSTSLAYQA